MMLHLIADVVSYTCDSLTVNPPYRCCHWNLPLVGVFALLEEPDFTLLTKGETEIVADCPITRSDA
jgi:hypothetical protein